MLVARITCLTVVTLCAIRVAWIGDDALITLRVALNLSHGWGPGFNATESVMAYTHPLWFLAWLGAGTALPSWIAAAFALSLTLSVIAIALVVWSARTPGVLIAATGSLLLSSAFIDYTSSGLETPLAYVTIGLAVLQVCRISEFDPPRFALLGLTIAAVVLTRLDLAIVLLPVTAYAVLIRWRSTKTIAAFALGLLAPVVLWFCYAWVTYATLLPNTFLAKTNLGIPRVDLILQGFRYLLVSGSNDLFTVIVLVGGIAVLLARGDVAHRLIALGVATYLGYVVWIGGDFMTGRFLAVPVFVIVLTAVLALQVPVVEEGYPALVPAVVALVVLSAVLVSTLAGFAPTSLLMNPRQKFAEQYGIVDERGVYAELGRGLNSWIRDERSPANFRFADVAEANPWESLALYDQAASSWPDNQGGRMRIPSEVGVVCWLGGTSIMTGPKVHWIDTCALADRYLAETPARPGSWRIGHFQRVVPNGYVEAVRTASVAPVSDPLDRQRLVELWEKIRR